jgi:hypothetical protein
VYFFPESRVVCPTFRQGAPVLTAEIPASALNIEIAIERLITKANPLRGLN